MSKRLKPYDVEPLIPQVADTSRAGASVRIKGQRGTYVIVEEVLAEAGEWVVLYGGPAGKVSYRHVRPDSLVWPRPKRTKKEQS